MALSTVSGGTLTGVAYAKAVQNPNFKFDEFFKDFYDAFDPKTTNNTILQKSIEKLTDKNQDSVWANNSHKRKSLINAFALTYNEMDLFKGTYKMFDREEMARVK
jgi:hypothetical protein